MVQSFLSPSDIAGLTTITQSALETKMALNGGSVSLVISRWNSLTESWDALPAQDVLITYADAANPQTIQDESGQSVVVDGWISKIAPLSAKRGDLFSVGVSGSEESGQILRVFPAKLGVQKAAFKLAIR